VPWRKATRRPSRRHAGIRRAAGIAIGALRGVEIADPARRDSDARGDLGGDPERALGPDPVADVGRGRRSTRALAPVAVTLRHSARDGFRSTRAVGPDR